MTACRDYEVRDARPVLKEGAVYWGDNGRRLCVRCAGMSAKFTGRDLSGQKVARVRVEDVRTWEAEGELGPLACEEGCTTLSAIAGPDGWPLAREGSAR